MDKKYLIANWKANPDTVVQAQSLALGIARFVHKYKKVSAEVIIASPFVYLEGIADILKKSKVKLAGQDFFNEDRGAFTAQVTAPMLHSLKAKYVILGHSEVREENGDDNREVNRKIKLALEYDLRPIVCMGEQIRSQAKKVLEIQFKECLTGIKTRDLKELILCYEPVWAISKGRKGHKAASPQVAQFAHVVLRKLLVQKYGSKVAQDIPIIYGGSIKPTNAQKIFQQLDIDGGLVGSSSLSVTKFSKIIRAI